MSFNIFLLVICTLLVHCANCQCPTLQGVTFTEIEHTSNKPDCYAIIATPMTWDDASAYCKSVNSLLLAIDRAEEARKIAEHLISEAYDASEWFHLGLRRIESNNPLNIPTGESELGKVGYAWIDGNLFTDNIETYFNEEETDIFEYGSSGASAFQFRLSADQLSSTQGAKHLTLGFKGGNRSASLEVTAKFVCDMDDELICGEKAVPGFLFRDSRMTPALCTASCIADSKTGYAFISGEECYCSSNPSVLTSTTREPCDLPCKGEEWLSCGTTNDDWGMYRRLRFNFQSASTVKDLLRCAQLYGNGLLKKMDFSSQNCSNELSDNYCDRPDYFPVGGKCVFIATADLPRDYQNAQFEMCGKQEHSDMFVLSEASVPEVNTAYPSKFWSKPYSVGESSEGAALAGFHGSLAQEIPWLAGPTLYCEKHVGDLGCVSIADIESGTNVPATGYIKNPSRLVNIYGCIEKCRGLDSAYAAFVTNSSCMCGAESLVNESVMSQSPSECYGTPCPDPGTNQQCPSQVTSARAFNISMYPSLAVSCVELWKNGAYDVGPYRIRLDATESHERFKFLAHCTRVPVYMESSGVIQLSSQTVGHSVPESSQLRPGLFSTDQWDVSGMGFHFNMDAASTLELKFVDGFHLIRGITLLGRGDLDVAGSETYGLKDAFPTGCEVSFMNLTNEWEAAIDAQQPKDKRDVSSVNHTNKGILWTMVLKPKIASAIAVKLTEWENKPIIRVEVIGDSLSSWEKVKRILDQRANETSLGCYGVSKSDRELSSLTLTAIPEYIDTQLEKVKLYCNSLEINLVVAEQLADGVTTYYCLPHGDYFYDKMDDVSLCEYGRCAELDQSKCDKFRRFVTLHELHDEQNFECSEPPAIPSPSNYAWNGSNLIYHQRSLVCEEPTSEDYGIIETFTCQENLTWDKDIDLATFEGCIQSCPEPLPINSSANYTWNGTNFINQQMTLVCEEPSSRDYGVIETFTCQQSLQWNKDINSVTFEGCIKSCPEPPPIDTPGNYTWNGTNFIYQQINLVCEEPSSPDYGIIETFTCQENLTWDKDIDSATFEGCIKSCPDVAPTFNSSSNHTWNGTNFIYQQMTLVCEEPQSPDYGIVETFTCQENLTWDKDIESVTFSDCTKTESCPDLPSINSSANYAWCGVNFVDYQMTLLCDEPSSPDHGIVETFTCQENLTWDKDFESVTLPDCLPFMSKGRSSIVFSEGECPSPTPFPDGVMYYWIGDTKINESLSIVCRPPYEPKDKESWDPVIYKCLENATWDMDITSPELPQCVYARCKSLPPDVANAHHEFYPDTYTDQTKVLEYINYECDEEYEWDFPPGQRALCLADGSWTLQSLLVSKCISENDCDKYIPGFQNTSENLHPDYKYIDSAAYNEFKKKVWKYGSFKEIRCPIGLEFTNARMRTFAYCSSELKGWFLPFGPCYNSRNPGDQVGSLQSGPAFDLRFLPGAILVGIATIVILSCYAMFTVMNRRRRNNLEMDGEDFKPPPTESVALVVQQQPEPPKTQIVEVPAPPKTLQPLALPGPKGRKGAVQASARSMADASMRSCVVDNKSFITMFDDACEPDEDEKPEATTEANQNGGLPLENEQKPEQEDELIAGTKAGSDPRSGPSADTAALAPPAELEPLSPPDEPDTIASSGWSSDKNSSPGFANRDTFAKH